MSQSLKSFEKYIDTFYLLLWLHFTIRETKVNYYLQKLNVSVTSPVAKKTQKIKKLWENLQFNCWLSSVPSLPSRNENLVTAIENSHKSRYLNSTESPILLNLLHLCQIFCEELELIASVGFELKTIRF